MQKNKPIIKIRRLVAMLTVVVTTTVSIASGIAINTIRAKAAGAETKTSVTTATPSAVKVTPSVEPKNKQDYVDLRMVFTTDLHGTLSSMDYISGVDFKNSGLSRAYSLIQKTRNEKESSNVFTFDVGDVLFEASMEYIMGQDEEEIQPIYLGMAMVGYDAITLGNHDFEYGKNYILKQLTGSGLLDQVVVSNLMNEKDDSHPFHENMMIERQVVTHEGEKVAIKVGVIGETIPTLSKKTDNYTGIWKTEDIVENVKKESALLRSQGADVIVVLAHSAFGEETPQLNADNVTYALTKIEDVDVILCGHGHNEFPTSSRTEGYYKYTGVDPETNLVNGKVVVMAKCNGQAIGVADLTLGFSKQGEYTLEKKSGEVRSVTDYKVQENSKILACIDGWKEELETYRTKQLIQLADGVTLQNYLGLQEDSEVLQLQNNARIAYARKYIDTVQKEYSDYPIIAAASHISYGANSEDDFVHISKSITNASLFTVQNYRNYTFIYMITGAQLIEWLELTASAYATLDPNIKEPQFLVQSDWMENWSQFYVFDGINYTINPYNPPRYNINAKKINSTRRVSDITYQGKKITEDMQLVIACNSLSSNGIFSWASNQKIKGKYRTQYIIDDYLMSLSKFGKYTPTVDHNWFINLKEGQEFLMLLPNTATSFAEKSSIYKKTELVMEDKTIFRFQADETVISEPQIVALQSNLEPTMTAYDVYVDAFSSSGIKTVKYATGIHDINDFSCWNMAKQVTDHKFLVYFNDTYTIYAEDNNGKKATYQVIIDNIGVKEMAAPKVASFNNTKTKITGNAEAGATVYVELKNKTYKGKANSDGSYSIAIPCQISGTTFYVRAEDLVNGRKSDKTKVYVKYNKPNKATVDKYYNNSLYLTGKTNQKEGFLVAIDENTRRIFVNKVGGKDVLLSSTEVDYSTYSIMEVDVLVDEEGNFTMDLPNIDIGSSICIFNMDYLSRVGVSSYITVAEGGPYSPTINNAVDAENIIYGSVDSVSDVKRLSVVVTVDGETYNTVTDNSGDFLIYLEKPLVQGNVINAYAKDEKKGKIRNSKTTVLAAKSITTMERSNEISISKPNYNSSSITVKYLPNRDISIYIPYLSGSIVENVNTDESGLYKVKLEEELVEGSLVKVISRNNLNDIVAANYDIVTYRKPTKPELVTELTNYSNYIKAVTKEDVPLFAVIQGATIESAKGEYNKENKGYVHVIKFDRMNSGTKVVLYSKNFTTKSDDIIIKVTKAAPDAPTVSLVNADSIEITGTVEIFLLNSDKKPTVKNTKTKVFARVNGTNYTGTVNQDGSFVISVPKVESGMELSVYAYNKNGYGPETKIVIK